MRGPHTSSEKLPLPMVTTRSGCGQLSIARLTTRPSSKQRCADGSGGTWPLMKIGTTGICICGVMKCSGTTTEWSTVNSCTSARSKPASTPEAAQMRGEVRQPT